MPELDPLFAELRREYEPDAVARQRVRRRVGAAIAVGSVLVTGSAAASIGGAASGAGALTGVGKFLGAQVLGASVLSWSAGAKVSAMVAVGLAASLTGGMLWNELSTPPATPVAVSATSPDTEPVVERARGLRFSAPPVLPTALALPPLEAATSLSDDPSAVVASEVPSAARSRSLNDKAPRSSEVLEDLRLLQQASQALRAGNAGEARSLLDEHERRFPRSVVRQERTGLALLVRCSSTAGESVRADAERFVKAQPNSPLAEHIRKQCLP
jgi:hypothetical protein